MPMHKFNLLLKNIRIIKISFDVKRKPPKKPTKTINPVLSINHEFNEEHNELHLLLSVKISSKNLPFSLQVSAEGIFEVEGKINDAIIEQLAFINCPAIIFPYVREAIADVTRRGGFPPVHIPPINFVELAKRIKEKQEGENRNSVN